MASAGAERSSGEEASQPAGANAGHAAGETSPPSQSCTASMEQQLEELKREVLQLQGTLLCREQLQHAREAHQGGLCRRLPVVSAADFAVTAPEDRVPNEHGLPTVTVESMAAACEGRHDVGVGLHIWEPVPGAAEDDHTLDSLQRVCLFASKRLAQLLRAPDQETARAWVQRSVEASVGLRNYVQAVLKSYLMGDFSAFMVRTIMYHSDKPADISLMWFLPCVVRHAGHVHKYAFVTYSSGEETQLHMYESVMHDHLGLKFTPVIVNMVEMDGLIVHQNAASMAAFGMQGYVHRAEGSPSKFNLLDQLFMDQPSTRAEMEAVTSANNMFSLVMAIRSPLLREWLGIGERDVWHQVQISRARDAVTNRYVYVVAQVDVTAAVLAETQVVRLMAENDNLAWTTAWLEQQRLKADEVNQRLKESLAQALASRDGLLQAGRQAVSIDTDSPADKAIKLLNKVLEGQEVSSREVMAVRDVLLEAGTDMLQPVNFVAQMDAQIGATLDAEVGQSLIDLLVTKRTINITDGAGSSSNGGADGGGGSAPGSMRRQATLGAAAAAAAGGRRAGASGLSTAEQEVEGGGGDEGEAPAPVVGVITCEDGVAEGSDDVAFPTSWMLMDSEAVAAGAAAAGSSGGGVHGRAGCATAAGLEGSSYVGTLGNSPHAVASAGSGGGGGGGGGSATATPPDPSSPFAGAGAAAAARSPALPRPASASASGVRPSAAGAAAFREPPRPERSRASADGPPPPPAARHASLLAAHHHQHHHHHHHHAGSAGAASSLLDGAPLHHLQAPGWAPPGTSPAAWRAAASFASPPPPSLLPSAVSGDSLLLPTSSGASAPVLHPHHSHASAYLRTGLTSIGGAVVSNGPRPVVAPPGAGGEQAVAMLQQQLQQAAVEAIAASSGGGAGGGDGNPQWPLVGGAAAGGGALPPVGAPRAPPGTSSSATSSPRAFPPRAGMLLPPPHQLPRFAAPSSAPLAAATHHHQQQQEQSPAPPATPPQPPLASSSPHHTATTAAAPSAGASPEPEPPPPPQPMHCELVPSAAAVAATARSARAGSSFVTGLAPDAARGLKERHLAVGLAQLCRSPPDPLARVLATTDDWGFDPWRLNEASQGRPLSCLGFYLMHRHLGESMRSCGVDLARLCRFLIRVEDDYNANPYHNRVHAADVLQWTHVLMQRGGVLRALSVGDAGVLGVYLSAIVHDLNHCGLNNDYLVRSNDALALLYNDQSPMENHHLAHCSALLKLEEYDFLHAASDRVKQTLRKQIIKMVLATDMKQHFTQVALFKSKLGVTDDAEAPAAAAAVAAAPPDGAASGQPSPSGAAPAGAGDAAEGGGTPAFVLAAAQDDDEIKGLILAVALKCADLGNLAAPTAVNGVWVQQLEEEYFRQGDLEQANGLSVSALMDRSKAGVSKSQTGFLNIVGLPLFRMFVKAFPQARPMLDGAMANFEHWRAVEEEQRRQAAMQAASAAAPP